MEGVEEEFLQNIDKLKNDLNNFAYTISKLNLNRVNQRSLYFFEEQCARIEEELNSYIFQTAIVSFNNNEIEVILRNLEFALNNVSKYKIEPDLCIYLKTVDFKYKQTNNRIESIIPENFEDFKTLWYLFIFAPLLRGTFSNIKEVLGISAPHRVDENKLSFKQIALIHAYNGQSITDGNKNQIVKKHGWTSGAKLKQIFDENYYKTVDRIGTESTERKTENKIKLIESVIEFLSKDEQDKANNEIESLANAMRNEFY